MLLDLIELKKKRRCFRFMISTIPPLFLKKSRYMFPWGTEKVGAFRATRTDTCKVGAFRANKAQKGGFTAAHTRTAIIWESPGTCRSTSLLLTGLCWTWSETSRRLVSPRLRAILRGLLHCLKFPKSEQHLQVRLSLLCLLW